MTRRDGGERVLELGDSLSVVLALHHFRRVLPVRNRLEVRRIHTGSVGAAVMCSLTSEWLPQVRLMAFTSR